MTTCAWPGRGMSDVLTRPRRKSLHHQKTAVRGIHSVPYTFFIRLWMSVPLTPFVDKNRITARWACLEESMAWLLTVISLLFQSTTHCHYQVYTKFPLTYTAIYRRNRKVLPLGITALQPQSHFHLGTPYIFGVWYSMHCIRREGKYLNLLRINSGDRKTVVFFKYWFGVRIDFKYV